MKKFLTAAFMTVTLTAGVISVHALGTKTQAQTCGQTCFIPGASCPKGCFCQISGVDTGVCMKR